MAKERRLADAAQEELYNQLAAKDRALRSAQAQAALPRDLGGHETRGEVRDRAMSARCRVRRQSCDGVPVDLDRAPAPGPARFARSERM